ncbi:MAG TPA: hypothetical protein VH308_07705 [Terracidiphilus sp.]|jgi:hypothetical protein|nr:hypothetical protein [Terracidiphilus sp.]
MRRIILLLVMTLGIATPLIAAKPISVERLEQLLAAAHGQSDGKVAHQLSSLELTERASSLRLSRWLAAFPGRHAQEALTSLADASAFLDLPASEIPPNPPPAQDAQREIISKALDFADQTFNRLPNFYATRQTERFEDTPPQQTIESASMAAPGRGMRGAAMPSVSTRQNDYVPLHFVARSSVNISYRDGYELRDSKRVDFKKPSQPEEGLTTSGEFGPILGVVLAGDTPGKMKWGHWEQGATGLEAVFQYSVPQGQSKYMVSLPIGRQGEQLFPAYHGEIAIDPANGNILRVSVIADFPQPHQNLASSIAVEYGSIPIGGSNYICPVRSVAASKMPFGAAADGPQDANLPVKNEVNDVAFTDYHLFRAEARILTGDSATGSDPAPGAPAPAAGASK